MSNATDDTYDLNRFVEAQKKDYAVALAEIRRGKKRATGCGYLSPGIRPWLYQHLHAIWNKKS